MLIRRLLGAAQILLMLLTCSMVAAAPAYAALTITKIYFNPVGADSGDPGHIRKEIVVIKNTGSHAVRLDGWRIHDAGRDHVYVFGDRRRGDDVFTDVKLRPREYVRVHSGRGQDSATVTTHGDVPMHYDFYWDLDNYVWNNDGDRAILRNRAKGVIDRCAYTASADSPKMC